MFFILNFQEGSNFDLSRFVVFVSFVSKNNNKYMFSSELKNNKKVVVQTDNMPLKLSNQKLDCCL